MTATIPKKTCCRLVMGTRIVLLGIFCTATYMALAQVKISGIVIDSVSFKSLSNVHIRIKGKSTGTVTDDRGHFTVLAAPFDTLAISIVGYIPVTFPVLINEEDILILMSEDVTYLQPVIVTGAFIRSPLIRDKRNLVYRTPRAAKLVTGSGIAFDYFSREQRERRKLQRLIEVNEKMRSYNQLVTDPDFKNEMTTRYVLTEVEYYSAILNFNQTRITLIEYKTPEEVARIMNDYFCLISNHCR
jgi:CarboxypepD_reg-like domain